MTKPPISRSRRHGFIVLGIAVVIAAGVAIRSRRPETLLPISEFTAKTSETSVKIDVGPNVQVSLPFADKLHREVVAVADPSDPKKLLAAAMCLQKDNRFAVIGYRSEDGGKTWQTCFTREQPTEAQCDPTLAAGPDGLVYLAIQVAKHPTTGPNPANFHFFRSQDSGKSWETLAVVSPPKATDKPTDLDRPFIGVDRTNGPHRGRVYCASNWGNFHWSTDQGQTFQHQTVAMDSTNVLKFTSSPVTLSDGKMIFVHQHWLQTLHQPCGLAVVESDDGGSTLRPLAKLEPRWKDQTRYTDGHSSPLVAVDQRDRLFAVWGDGDHPGRDRILFARSDNKGKTWTRPTIISEQPADQTGDYNALMPALAVNKDGVIAVCWYDRRGLPVPDRNFRSPDNTGSGCNVRLRVSLDGGETWQPSVQVNSTPIKAKVHALRDTMGLVADAEGTFHPFWIDDRTGKQQVWTAPVRVLRE